MLTALVILYDMFSAIEVITSSKRFVMRYDTYR